MDRGKKVLTESERHWAINAKMRLSHKNDFRCGKCGVHCYVPYAPCFCVMTKEDVTWEIEFLSRVAAKLARQAMKYVCEKYPCRHGRPALGCLQDKTKLTGPYAVHCEDCFLREVRLQVEEEMDNDT